MNILIEEITTFLYCYSLFNLTTKASIQNEREIHFNLTYVSIVQIMYSTFSFIDPNTDPKPSCLEIMDSYIHHGHYVSLI